MYFDQKEYDVRFEWGLSGLQALAHLNGERSPEAEPAAAVFRAV